MKKLLYCIILSSVILGCGNTNNNEIYSIGTEIAEGVGTSLAVGFSLMDSDLTYKIITSNDEFTSQGNTWPIIDVSVIVKSDVLSNPKITFVMLLEIDNSSGTIAGTVKNIKADGLADSSLDVMNNTMYIKTDEGIEQVQIIDGELRFIEQAEINTAHQSEIVSKDFYIIATDIASNENEASEKVNKLKAAGYASDYLWIPDYKSLSGAEYFSVFIGPFRSESECAIAVQEYRKNNPSAYGLLISNESSKRVSITGPNKITEGSNIKKFNIQAKEKIITFNEATDFMQKRSKNIDQTTKYLELKTYLKQNHLTGFWIKKDFNTYVFHEPNLKSFKELWSTDNSWGKNAPILFNERWTITAKVLKNERKIEYIYSTF